MKPHFLRFWLYKFLCELAEMMNLSPKTKACSLPTLNYVHLRELQDPSEDPLVFTEVPPLLSFQLLLS